MQESECTDCTQVILYYCTCTFQEYQHSYPLHPFLNKNNQNPNNLETKLLHKILLSHMFYYLKIH